MARRLGYLAIIIIWLTLMCFPVLAFLIATRGEIRFGDITRSGIRVHLVQEVEAQGLGIEWSRRTNRQSNCSRTTVRYLLWEGESAGYNTEYCLCYDLAGQYPQVVGSCEEP